MAARIKTNFRAWMLIYIGLGVTLLSADPPRDLSVTPALPQAYPSGFTVDDAILAPGTARHARGDI